jgi:hypothetical protein
MFHQTRVAEKDRDLLRFLWWNVRESATHVSLVGCRVTLQYSSIRSHVIT